jgi:lysylphosphatidylglycerol synthetase-like protein (DUF2156 family)
MEPLVAATVFATVPGLVSATGGVLSVVALAATAEVVAGAAAESESRLLALGRGVCVAFAGLLVAAGFLGLLTRWALAVACVAFLLAILAVALRHGQGRSLQAYLDARGDEEQPAWWPAFEHGFRRYASTGRRDHNPLRRAVTRPTSQTADADGGRVARRSPDVMIGRRP